MSFKLAFKNIRKSIKDYSIYFFTLVVAVAIFYVFNSLDSQESMLQMSKSKMDIIKTLVDVLGYLSIFISVVLGFLIIYSNNFLIKRRKKEFGLYLTLGMSKRKVSTILLIETLLVGIISLVIGLILGIGLSQILSILTAKLFEVDMSKFQFVFSSYSLMKTIIYFGIIYLLVMVFNVISISRYKLIDLLMAGRKNEKIKFRNKFIIIISFILSVGLLSYAYYLLFNDAILNFNNKKFIYMIASGSLGTLLLFFSASGFFLKLSQLNKKFYYKNLNMFILKQVNNKVNTTVISNTVISLMLLLTIGILSSSISLVNAFNTAISKNNMTDFSITEHRMDCKEGDITYCYDKAIDDKLKDIPNKDYFKDNVNNYVYYSIYDIQNINPKVLIYDKSMKDLKKEYGENVNFDGTLDIISESSYNKILNLYGKEKIDIKENEYLLTSNLDAITKFYKSFYSNSGSINIKDKKLTPATEKIVDISLLNSSGGSNVGTIVVDDSIISILNNKYGVIIGNYNGKDKEKIEEQLLTNLNNENNNQNNNQNNYELLTKINMETSSIGIKAIFTFVGLYLGIVFAISSATILAIGQLSESTDNKDRYRVLRQLGADNKMIKRALFSQIAIAFGFPLIVAIIHSIFGLKEINNIIKILGSIDLTSNIILTSSFIVILFGGYFLATYIFSKNIIKE